MLRERVAEIERLLRDEEISAAEVRECPEKFLSRAEERLCFSNLFDMEEIQKIQDAFAKAAGVASLITTPQGKPLTKPSSFCRLCRDIIRKTEKGRINCMHSDAVIGRYNPSGPVIRPCLSGGLWDGGASISAGDQHIGNWLIGQVRNEYLDMEKMMQYAREIGANEEEFRKALEEVPVMSQEQFIQISQALFLIANLMSQIAYRNLQQKQAAEEMQRLRNLLDRIVRSMPSQIIGIDREGRVMLWNPESERFTGIAAADAVGRRLAEILPFCSEERKKIEIAIRENKTCGLERLMWEKKGEKCFFDVIVYPLASDGAEGSVVRIDDITKKIRMEEMIIQSEKMISVGGLAAGMAHEINNPLGGILQGVQNIQRRISPLLSANTETANACGTDLNTIRSYLERRHIFQFLEGIRKSGERAAKIVDNMLRFSRGSGSLMSPENLAELVDKTVDLASHDYDLAKKYDFRNIEVIREIDPQLPEVMCMATEIEQVVLNLLRNAAQAMFPQRFQKEESVCVPPRIILRLYRKEDAAIMEVEDSGPGMDENTQRRVFEPFFTTKPAECGTGLGLSISYFIITNNHKGAMRVESEPGKGTKFIVSLPLKQDDTAGTQPRHIASFI